MTHPRRRPRTAAAALAVSALAATAAVPAVASAATSGATTIELGGAVARSLRSQGVTLSASKPAKANARRITLPVTRGKVGNSATLQHGGSVSFRSRSGRRTRVARFTSWQTKLAPKRSTITAKLGKRRVALFVLTFPKRARTSAAETDGTVRLSTSTVRLTSAGAQTLRRSLELTTLPAGVLGRAKVDATVDSGGDTRPTTPGTGGGNTGGGGGNTGGGGGGGTTPPPGGGQPEVRPIESEPPVLARPAGAVDVSSATITWWVRDSFIRYIWGSPSGGTSFAGGVVGGAEIEESAHACSDIPAGAGIPPLRYSFTFPFARGWYDAASQSAGIYGSGSVTFKYPEHGIDLTANDPEIELTGANARAIMRFNGTGSTNPGNRRGILVTLATAGTTPTPGGPLVTYRGTLPTTAAGNGDIFAGFYPKGSPFGCFQVSFATS